MITIHAKTIHTTVNEGDSSPWGKIQDVYPVIPGMDFVATAGHGGIKLSRTLNAGMPHYLRSSGGWYEEDCEWAMVFAVYEKEILAYPGITGNHVRVITDEGHKATFRSYYPYQYERFYGVTLKPGESYARDQENFLKEHANDFVVVSAVNTSNDMVRCTASRGKSYKPGREERYYLVPQEEYNTRNQFGFVIDESRHTRLSDIATMSQTG